MKNSAIIHTLIHAIIILASASCSRPTDTQLIVHVDNLRSELTIEINKQSFSISHPFASKTLYSNKPTARFYLTDSDEPTIYQVNLLGVRRTPITLLIKRGEQATLTLDMLNLGSYSIEGSEESLLAKELTDRLRKSSRTIDSLERLQRNTDNPIALDTLAMRVKAVKDSQRVFSSRFIWEHPRTLASFIALYQQYSNGDYVFDTSDDLTLFRVVGSALQVMYPESAYTKGIIKDLSLIHI